MTDFLDLSLDESYHFKKFGKYIGLAYQIQDDLLEVFADSNKMNKSLHSDFLLDKKTYPWILSISENKNKMLEIKSAMHEDIDSGILNYRKFLNYFSDNSNFTQIYKFFIRVCK